jgi:hypothetical protein
MTDAQLAAGARHRAPPSEAGRESDIMHVPAQNFRRSPFGIISIVSIYINTPYKGVIRLS